MLKAKDSSGLGCDVSLIVHIYFAAFRHESRAMRAINSILEAQIADRVETIAYKTDETLSKEIISDRFSIRRYSVNIPLPLPRLIRRGLSWLLWTILTVIGLRRRAPAMIHVHALSGLPAAILAKWVTGAKVLYNAHDLETERTGWGAAHRLFARTLERIFIEHIDGMVTVSDMIADWYVAHYGIRRPALVRNIPIEKPIIPNESSEVLSIRKVLGIPKEDLLFVYIGAIGPNRGISILISAFSKLPTNYHFATLGYGELEEDMIEASRKHANIHHHPAIAGDQVTTFIRDADVGVCLIEDVSMNHRLTLPNKLFETRHGGLAALVSDLPAIADFINKYGGGWKVAPNVDSVIECVRQIDRKAVENIMASARPIPEWKYDRETLLTETRRVLSL